jgi:ABC transport system ATP-binding/permease protein
LVLDEPTNDLDIESLSVLEELLLEYSGTVIIISHDREFIDNIATHTIAFEETGSVTINVGGYTDWLERKKAIMQTKKIHKDKNKFEKKQVRVSKVETKKNKLTFKEQQELNELPEQLEKLEEKILTVESLLAQSDFYQRSQAEIQTVAQDLETLKKQRDQAYQRWQELDG